MSIVVKPWNLVATNVMISLYVHLCSSAGETESQRVQAEERGNKLKQLLVRTKKELADGKTSESELRAAHASLTGQMERQQQTNEELKVGVVYAILESQTTSCLVRLVWCMLSWNHRQLSVWTFLTNGDMLWKVWTEICPGVQPHEGRFAWPCNTTNGELSAYAVFMGGEMSGWRFVRIPLPWCSFIVMEAFTW